MEILDITNAMQSILLHHTRGYTLWVDIRAHETKIPALDEKWALSLGTHEPGWKRQDRKQHDIPNAVAIAGRVFSQPGQVEIVLLATANARHVNPGSPHHAFLREQWRDDLPRFSHFEMAHQPTEAQGKLVWTWRIRKIELNQIEKRLVALTDARDVETLKRETHSLVRSFPMFNGIRSQVRRLLRHVQRKCAACHIDYPGPDPENLPMMLRFPRTRATQMAREVGGRSPASSGAAQPQPHAVGAPQEQPHAVGGPKGQP